MTLVFYVKKAFFEILLHQSILHLVSINFELKRFFFVELSDSTQASR